MASCACSTAPMTALPTTAPSWRIVLKTPDAAPVSRGVTSRIAIVVIGAKTQPIPRPASISGGTNVCQLESGDASQKRRPVPVAKRTRPVMRKYLPPNRSTSRPEKGATTIETSDSGATVKPAESADIPSTDCR